MGFFTHTKDKIEEAIHEADAFAGKEFSIFEAAVITEARKQVPGLTHDLWVAIKAQAGVIVQKIEHDMAGKSGDEKWNAAMADFVHYLEVDGIQGLRVVFSQSLKESVLQAGVMVAKAGLGAIVASVVAGAL